MPKTLAKPGRVAPTLNDARVKAILKRGAIWDEREFMLLRAVLPLAHSRAMAGRIRTLLRDFEHGDNEHAA